MNPNMLLVIVLVASAFAEPQLVKPYNYHQDVGIPLAAKIKEAEEKIFAQNDINNKIIGGSVSADNSHPYLPDATFRILHSGRESRKDRLPMLRELNQGGLLITFWNIAGTSVCGSSLLSANRAVTAAHCWFDGVNRAREYTVVLGTNYLFSGGLRVLTSDVFMHPQWNPSNLNNDVAMIFLPYSISLSGSVQPITLPSPSQLSETFAHEWAKATGFGKTTDQQLGASTFLSEVYLQVITVGQCQAVYGPAFVTHSTLCTNGAGGVGVCSGDSGGPLFITRNGQRILIGISSFAAQNACSHGHPSGFARVTSFYDFITSNM